ncbi:DUF1446 domain-containing protein [Vibrio kyushuensis]|uniref:hypothetical protein n=1 Tax=Vibrio kyushuensis TaxID=2910249 RepID=UPI003D100DEB
MNEGSYGALGPSIKNKWIKKGINMRTYWKLAAIIFYIFQVTACALVSNDPIQKERLRTPELKPLDETSWEVRKVSYLGINLFGNKKRNTIATAVASSEEYAQWTSANLTGTSMVATDIAVGQVGSSLGQSVGASVLVGTILIDAFTQDRADYISRTFIPTSANIDTQEAANNYVHQFHLSRVEAIADLLNVDYECLEPCKPNKMLIRFKNINWDGISHSYLYTPKELYLYVLIQETVRVDSESALHSIMGEQIDWQTNGYNSSFANFYEPANFDELGEPILGVSEDGEKVFGKVKHMGFTHIGRDLSSIYYNDPMSVYGNGKLHPDYIFYNGSKYAITLGSEFADELVVEANYLSYKNKLAEK